jgi:hypothetical protein
MTDAIPFASAEDLRRHAADRPILLFGRGNNAERTARLIGITPGAILDNNPNVWDTTLMGVPVVGPDHIDPNANPRPFMVICSTSFGDICDQLAALGLTPRTDFAVSPILENQRVVAELERLNQRLYATSGLPPGDGDSGGGIYEITVDGDHRWRRVHRGNCHGLIQFGEGFIGIDDNLGIVEFDSTFTVLRNTPLPAGSRAHGVDYSDALGLFVVACAFSDTLLLLDRDFATVGELAVSGKRRRDGEAAHHINDVLVVGSSAYLSMFSLSGNWKRGVYDGGILEFDLERRAPSGPVATGLWMPHSVSMIGDSMAVLDSLRGTLLKDNLQEIGRFPGFMRGLAHDGRFAFIGQSRNRNLSYSLGVSNNISIDSGIVVFDEITKVSRTLHLPPAISEIHAVALAAAEG